MKSLLRRPTATRACLPTRHTRARTAQPRAVFVASSHASDYMSDMSELEVPDLEVVVKDIVDQTDAIMYKFEEIPTGTFKLDKKGARVRQVVVKADALLEEYSGTVRLSYGPSQDARTGTLKVSSVRATTVKQRVGAQQQTGTGKQRVATGKQKAGSGTKQEASAESEQAKATSRARASTMGQLLEVPEAINARAAMVGWAGALASECLTHQPVAHQLGAYPAATAFALVTGVVTSAVVASLIPVFRASESVRDRSFWVFTPDLEVAVGRTAMVAFVGWVGLEAVLGGVALFGGSGAVL